MLHMPIRHVHKSLADINEENILLCQLFFNCNSTKKQNQLFTMLSFALFVELISILDNTIIYFNYDFNVSFSYKHMIWSLSETSGRLDKH